MDVKLETEALAAVNERQPVIATPTKAHARPKIADVSNDNAAEEGVSEDRPPTVSELAEIYMQPRQKIGPDVVVKLGGGVGPNPNGIKHTNGGPYVPPTPVPEKKPGLDLQASSE